MVSLTTDIWSCSSNDTSLLSLTQVFHQSLCCITAQAPEMAHTGQYIAERISSMLESWNIPQERGHMELYHW